MKQLPLFDPIGVNTEGDTAKGAKADGNRDGMVGFDVAILGEVAQISQADRYAIAIIVNADAVIDPRLLPNIIPQTTEHGPFWGQIKGNLSRDLFVGLIAPIGNSLVDINIVDPGVETGEVGDQADILGLEVQCRIIEASLINHCAIVARLQR